MMHKKSMSSYSGSGIFIESDKIPYLCGIITNLGSKEGTFSVVNGILISVIDDILYQKKEYTFTEYKME